MGKKKGRQCGQFQSKSMNAAHRTDWKTLASEATHGRRPFRPPTLEQGGRKGYGVQPSSSPSSISCRRSSADGGGIVVGAATERPRATVGLARLRGILAERVVEDRSRERDARRRRMTSSVVVASAVSRRGRNGVVAPVGGAAVVASEGGGKKERRHDPGWILFHGEEEGGDDDAIAGSSSRRSQRRGPMVPSLQTLAVRSLAPYLNEYVDQCGAAAVHGMLSALPSPVLADLSTFYCSSPRFTGVTDEVAHVLGGHIQVEGLALHASNDWYAERDGDGDDDAETEDAFAARLEVSPSSSRAPSQSSLTDAGILSLVPTLVSTRDSDGDRDDDDVRRLRPSGGTIDPPDSWEDNDDTNVSLAGCPNLRRLELFDARNVSAGALTALLRSCSRVTHLSVSGSFDVASGAELLLHPGRGLASLLPGLRVLDVSRCRWVSDALLGGFLRSLGVDNKEEAPPPRRMALEMINVAGCGAITQDFVDRTNERLGFALLSTEMQRRRGGGSSSESDSSAEGTCTGAHMPSLVESSPSSWNSQ